MSEQISLPPIILGSPGEEISKRDLHAIGQRFKNLHALRQQRIQTFLQPRQRVFLELLPLLFHINHALLPGYVAADTPAGIPEYQPSRATLNSAKVFSNSFRYKKRALKHYMIKALFLMGSVGSMAFTKSSDMDIWLCHISGLSDSELDSLQQKATAIEHWAETLGLEVHFFLIDSEQFRQGHCTPISNESSGNTQHFLLLEEFYRTSIYIAGCCPAWWLVPPHQEHNYSGYVQHLQQKRFISEQETIDFGGLEKVPAAEFISATLWHTYKSLGSPHKSLLKLLLMESYASEFPRPQWLSLLLKQAIYHGNFHLDEVDPYLLIYQKVDRYLKNAKDPQRIELARHCFYLKIVGKARPDTNNPMHNMRMEFLQQVARRYNWPVNALQEFGQRKIWNITKAVAEHHTILLELTNSYRATKGFASRHEEHNTLYHADLKLIGRKLFSFLEKKPGKIEIITTRCNIIVKDAELSIWDIKFASGAKGYGLYQGHLQKKKAQSKTIKTCTNLFELLAWLVVNKLHHKRLKLYAYTSAYEFEPGELAYYTACIDEFLQQYGCSEVDDLNIFRRPNTIIASLIIINAGYFIPEERQDGLLLISERSDCLSYGTDRVNFVKTIDRLSISSWGEVIVSRENNLEGLFSTYLDLFNNRQDNMPPSALKVICQSQHRGKSISKRLQDIYTTLLKLHHNTDSEQSMRYVLPGGDNYFSLQFLQGTLHYWQTGSEQALIEELSRPGANPGTVLFDQEVLQHTSIPEIYSQNIIGIVQIFLLKLKHSVTVTILDEEGTLFQQQYKQSTVHQLLSSYAMFLESIFNHDMLDFSISSRFYEIQINSAGVPAFVTLKPNRIFQIPHLSVRVSGKVGPNRQVQYVIYCAEEEFSTVTHGDDLFNKAAEYILTQRQQNEQYPVYVSDVDVPYTMLSAATPTSVQTSHYLKFKQKIEARLNYQ